MFYQHYRIEVLDQWLVGWIGLNINTKRMIYRVGDLFSARWESLEWVYVAIKKRKRVWSPWCMSERDDRCGYMLFWLYMYKYIINIRWLKKDISIPACYDCWTTCVCGHSVSTINSLSYRGGGKVQTLRCTLLNLRHQVVWWRAAKLEGARTRCARSQREITSTDSDKNFK